MPLLDNDGFACVSMSQIYQQPLVLTQVQQKSFITLAQHVIYKLSLRRNNRELQIIDQQLTETNGKLRQTEERLNKVDGK